MNEQMICNSAELFAELFTYEALLGEDRYS